MEAEPCARPPSACSRRRRRDRVVDVDVVSRVSEEPGERDAGALLDHAGVGLVGEAEDPDGVAVLEPRLDGPREPIGLGDVDCVGRLGEERRCAEVAREHGERLVVAREARPAVGDRPA